MAFDPTKPVRTRDGREACIVAYEQNLRGETIVAVIEEGGEKEFRLYYKSGSYLGYEEHPIDLVNIPERRSYWMNVYSDGQTGTSYHSLNELIAGVRRSAIARLELVYEDDKLVEVIKHDVSND